MKRAPASGTGLVQAGTNVTVTPNSLGFVVASSGGGGGGGTVTEVEVDFGSAPRYDAEFTITDAAISAASKVTVSESGKAATGRVAGDAQWDSISCAALPGTGVATVYAMAHPGPVVGRRILQYSIS